MAPPAKPLTYTKNPNGGYFFQQGNSEPLHLMGQGADNLAAWSDKTGGGGAGPMNVSLNPAAGITLQPRPQPAPTDGAAGGAAGGQPGGPLVPQDRAGAFIFAPEHHAGTAAYNPAKDAASRVPVPVSRTVTGGLDLSPDELKAHEENAAALHATNQAALHEIEAAGAEKVAAAEERRTQAVNAAISADNDRRESLQQRAAVEDNWNSTNSRLQKERDAVAQMKVDPQRLFSGPAGFVNRIMSAIAVGLGAFSASITKGPNYAQQIVDANIQRDIDAQTDEIHRRGAAAQNAITDFQKTYGLTLDEARSAVKANQLRYAASVADMNAARIGTADAKQQAAVLKSNFLSNAAAEEANLAEKYKGRTTTNFAMAAPRAAQAAYDSEPSYKTVKGRAEALETANKVVPQPKSPKGEAADRNADLQQQKFVTEYGEKRRDLTSAQADMDELAHKMGASINPDGTLTMPKNDIPGTGATARVPDWMLTDQGRDVRRQRSRVVSSVLKALTGMGVTKTERHDVIKQIQGTYDRDAVEGLQQARLVIRDYTRKLAASYGPDTVAAYDAQREATERMETAKEKAGATPEKL